MRFRLAAGLLLSVLLSLGARAQFRNITAGNATPITDAGHAYVTSPGGTISPATGALSFTLQLPLPPSRGFTLPFSISYDSGIWQYTARGGGVPAGDFYSPPAFPQANPLWAGGWTYTVPEVSAYSGQYTEPSNPDNSCMWYSDYTFVGPSGGRYALPIAPTDGDWCQQHPSITTGRRGSWIATSGPLSDPYLTVANTDGLKIYFPGVGNFEYPTRSPIATAIKRRPRSAAAAP
ncbi:MAG: hypothetical protein ACRD1Y_05395 [Terriglobales bacterium]